MFHAQRIENLLPLHRLLFSAGKIIQTHFGKVTPELKMDSTPVTQADLESNRFISDRLNDDFPGVPIVSEEHALSFSETPPCYWVLDPLDGTREFIHKIPEYCINLALIKNSVPVLGMIHHPPSGATFLAYQGLGSWKLELNGNFEKWTRLYSSPPSPHQTVKIGVSRFHPEPEINEFMKQFSHAKTVPIGASLKFSELAAGSIQVVPRFCSLSIWDVAAGDLIFRESGEKTPRPSTILYSTTRSALKLKLKPFVLGLD